MLSLLAPLPFRWKIWRKPWSRRNSACLHVVDFRGLTAGGFLLTLLSTAKDKPWRHYRSFRREESGIRCNYSTVVLSAIYSTFVFNY